MIKKIKRSIRTSKVLAPLVYQYKKKKFINMLTELAKVYERCKKHHVGLYIFTTPDPDVIRNLTEAEKNRIDNWVLDFNNVTEADMKILQSIYPGGITREYIDSVYDGTKIVDLGNKKMVADYTSKRVNFKNGLRLTPNNPAKYQHKICVFGACTARGTGVEDSKTIPSYLQSRINEEFEGSFCVNNLAVGCGSTLLDDINVINNECFKSGDIIIIISHMGMVLRKYAAELGILALDTSSIFDRPHAIGEWFTDETYHTNEYGNHAIGAFIFEKLKAKGCFKKKEQGKVSVMLPASDTQSIKIIESEEFLRFAEDLKKFRDADYISRKNGAIVMNCNPFTLGHRYLIETAASQVDRLYIFVVEENKSVFPYEDRFELVKKGAADLPNVCVLPSGKFIISALTFPGYFYKDNLKDTVLDTSNDVDIFARGIAPILNITVRFAGEEPLDIVTRQYNNTMRERLPLMNIEFCEIKRKEDSHEVISASRVRRSLEAGDWLQVARLVPRTTYDYLVERFGGKNA
ncbi:[Citrate [pro-3S]-lyase] ligase [Sporomusa ovata DSM 2662]|uniref:[Citrate [pro-3S]-lyase] ligase n=1 Tax=Sporomusa ovata TaxID=2378 RepID=A0A0U1KSX8_9FIRM|nr:adenylyltransferase/cytidyltransferase family protein [Sporomusa ovata]EQB26442.1 [citrate [pro-3S]-lyase] ligase [Sporomusa ovata DSM 2662]CQR70526.1 [Citrate [pro-3S]-lyase] ligase [Sporomusa ovata]